MKLPRPHWLRTLCLGMVLDALVAGNSHAGEPAASTAPAPERLSARLLREHGPAADTLGLHWRSAAERSAQAPWQSALLAQIGRHAAPDSAPDWRAPLRAWIQALPLTGRIQLAQASAYWLMAQPAQDPVLGTQDSLVLLPRALHVTVVDAWGTVCHARHAAGALARDYVAACQQSWPHPGPADSAWITQPDGRTMQAGLQAWNQEEQAEPAPGAWIWAPQRDAQIHPNTSELLARFLATQEPGERLFPAAPQVAAPMVNMNSAAPSGMQLTASDWGEIGLLQTPTARMAPAGELRLHFSKALPYTRGTLLFQPLDALEAAIRYTDVSNRLYGPSIAGDQSAKDKSIDLKLRLRQESAHGPALAVGMRDLGGTGLFSGEYLVANKRFGDWDASLGLGWGYLGARGNASNPFGWLDPSMNQRGSVVTGQGGTVSTSTMFRGPAAVFGGLQWSRKDSPWVWKVELDGNDYQHEPLDNHQTATSPLNWGLVYRYSPGFDISAGWERGNTWMLGLTLHGDLGRLYMPKTLDTLASTPPGTPGDSTSRLSTLLGNHTGWHVRSLQMEPPKGVLVAEIDQAMYLQERVDRAFALLHQHAPASVRSFSLELQRKGLPMLSLTMDRSEWEKQHAQAEAPSLRLPHQFVAAANTSPQSGPVTEPVRPSRNKLEWGPSYSQILGGPNNFLLYQMGVQAQAQYHLSDRTWFSADLNARLADNYGGFVYDAPSALPRVRTHQRQYVTTSVVTLPTAQMGHVRPLGADHYLGVYGGILEPMFAGAGAEWLYRPALGSWALGLDWNLVRQRDFAQNFGLRDYGVGTGHATLYWDTGWNGVRTKLSAGRYLAGDWGTTADFSRVFPNGVSAGFWATKTNVSAETFGEGSFDKGIYISIPFDAMLPKSSPGQANIVWSPLTRDGGAKLLRPWSLFDLTSARDRQALTWRAAAPAKARTGGESAVPPALWKLPAPTLADTPWDTTRTLGPQLRQIPLRAWGTGLAAIAASGVLLDSAGQRWAQADAAPAAGLASATNTVPLLMAAGAGSLALGIGGEELSNTAITALTAGAYTLGTNLVLRSTLGRARPQEEQGSVQFNGPGPMASQSGMPSNHVGLAFALATPFAQQYDMPWLYGLAASTALGRVHSQEHWVSDTVAGALIGYSIGSLLHEQQQAISRGMRWAVLPGQVHAQWRY
ncbi:MAG: YjbH domain-containing protein [Rhodoferax sp.]